MTVSETEIISTSVSSSERHTAFNSTTISSTEISQFSSEIQQVKSFSESTSLKTDLDDDLKWKNSNADFKQDSSSFTIDTLTSSNREASCEEKIVAERNHKPVPDIFGECKENLSSKQGESEMESYKLLKNALLDKPKCDTMNAEENIVNSTETAVSVTSLVKNIEKSDSFRSSEKVRRPFEEAKSNFEKSSETADSYLDNKRNKDFDEENELKSLDKSKPSLSMQENIAEKLSDSCSFTESRDIKMASSDSVNEVFKRSTIPEKLDSDFVLKPLKKDRRFSSDSDTTSEKQKDNSLVSSVYLEEESIMSNKSLAVGMEESRIFVSHHTSFSDDLKDILVTEAHNYAAVDKKSEISIMTSDDAISSKDREITEPYISSVGISSSVAQEKDIGFCSSASAVSNKRNAEDKITISVNSKSDNLKPNTSFSQNEDAVSPIPFQKSPSPTVDAYINPNAASQITMQKSPSPTPDTYINPKIAEKPIKPTQKSHLPDISSSMISVKNTNTQKRVSVEIVPFSQRMKERKYQPISFTNKECSSENKKNSSALVERKLSDRKVTKNKELDKSNNRHSFSGTLSTESVKEADLITAKKEVKKEKVQYPVQIRIHKTSPKPEIKEKNIPNISSDFKNLSKEMSDTQHPTHSAKVAQNEVKHLKEESKSLENTPKWEIKIQPATSHVNVPQTGGNEENTASLLSQKNFVVKSESFKSSQFTGNENNEVDLESAVNKCQENSWKSSPKDAAAASDDPEPELLRVFARRSIKQKHCDKSKDDEAENHSSTTTPDSSVVEISEKNNDMISISLNSTVIKISEISKPHITKPDLKKKSKSFCEKEKVVPRCVSPLKEMNLIQRDSPARSSVDSLLTSENLHPRQRIVKVEDAPLTLPPESEKKTVTRSAQKDSSAENSQNLISKEEQLHKPSSVSSPPPSTSVNGNISNLGIVKENQDVIAGKEAHTPAWLQLAQQRRELREQRERLLLGASPNSFMDVSRIIDHLYLTIALIVLYLKIIGIY